VSIAEEAMRMQSLQSLLRGRGQVLNRKPPAGNPHTPGANDMRCDRDEQFIAGDVGVLVGALKSGQLT